MIIEEIENKIIVIDNFLPTDEFNKIQNLMMGLHFPWHRFEGKNYYGDGNRQFVHEFFFNNMVSSPFYQDLFPLIKKVNPIAVAKVKANLLPKTETIKEFDYHTDCSQLCITAIYYINTNNGYTKFEIGEKVESVANRFVMFPSFLKHAGTTCTDAHDRVVINLNYYPNRKNSVTVL